MTRILLSGCNGRMGRQVAALAAETEEVAVVAGVDCAASLADFPVFSSLRDCDTEADVLVDFSNAAALPELLAYCTAHRLPAVLATTGYDEAAVASIREAARTVPIFRSANMSLGVNLLSALVRRAAQVLGADYNVEIVEMHHNQKLDAPSGTALLLADAAAEALPYDPEYVYDRHSVRKKRDPAEIGIHSLRGGTVVGEHSVLFAGEDEVITLSHSAQSRRVFATGALRAASFLAAQTAPRIYTMDDLIETL